MFASYQCSNVKHNHMQIIGVCQNKQCKQNSRRLCFYCIKDHQNNDQNFNYSDIKNEKELQQILNDFQLNHANRMSNIEIQCWIQQYLLNIEMIEYVKLWNYKYNRIHQILEQLYEFNNNKWKQINLHSYLDDENSNTSIIQYLQQYQQQLLYIDDIKDNYIKEIIQQPQYHEINVNTEQNKQSTNIVSTINEYMNKLVQNIISNDLYKLNNQQNEEFIISLCELMLKQGYDLRTDAIYDKFQILKDQLLDNSIEKYKSLYIQSYAIAFKQMSNESLKTIGLSLINQSLDIKGLQAKSLRIKGLFYFENKKYEDAIRMYDKAIQIDPKYVDAYIGKGESFRCLQKYQQSIEMFDEAIKIDPKCVNAFHNKGYTLDSLQKYQQAIQMYDEAIKLDPKYANAYIDKGVSLDNLQKYKEAIEMYNEAINIDPKQVDAYFNKGYSLDNLKQYELAIQVYDKAIQSDPKYFPAYVGKGDSLASLQQYQQAIEMYNEAIKIDPRCIQAYNSKGNSLRGLQKYQQAVEMYDEAIKIDPDLADAYYNKAISQYQLKQYQQAKSSFEKYLEYNPNDDDIKQMICKQFFILEQCDQQIQI